MKPMLTYQTLKWMSSLVFSFSMIMTRASAPQRVPTT